MELAGGVQTNVNILKTKSSVALKWTNQEPSTACNQTSDWATAFKATLGRRFVLKIFTLDISSERINGSLAYLRGSLFLIGWINAFQLFDWSLVCELCECVI